MTYVPCPALVSSHRVVFAPSIQQPTTKCSIVPNPTSGVCRHMRRLNRTHNAGSQLVIQTEQKKHHGVVRHRQQPQSLRNPFKKKKKKSREVVTYSYQSYHSRSRKSPSTTLAKLAFTPNSKTRIDTRHRIPQTTTSKRQRGETRSCTSCATRSLLSGCARSASAARARRSSTLRGAHANVPARSTV